MAAIRRCLSCLGPALPRAALLSSELECPCLGSAPGHLQPPIAATSGSLLFASILHLGGKWPKPGGAGSKGGAAHPQGGRAGYMREDGLASS